MKFPQCFSLYDVGDDVCDGDPRVEGDIPCGNRDKCAAFKRYAAATGDKVTEHGRMVQIVNEAGEPDKYFRPNDWDIFNKQLSEMVAEYGGAHAQAAEAMVDVIVDGTEDAEADDELTLAGNPKTNKGKPRKKRRRRPGRKARAMARRALMRAAKERRRMLIDELKLFRAALSEALPEYHWATEGGAVPPGRFYIKNRLITSGYASVYCKTAEGRDQPLALLRFKPRGLMMEVGLPVAPDEVSKSSAAKLALKPYNDGSFISLTKKLDRAGLGLAAEVIAAAVRSDKIHLPSARRPYGWKP